MVVPNKFELGQFVYLITDTDQSRRVITAITIRATGVIYELSCGRDTSSHYDFEISDEINMEVKVTNL